MPVLLTTIDNLVFTIRSLKEQGKRIGFVPTMGALHQGHLSLIEQGFSACDVVVVSIFVNPLQFNNSADFKSYPNTLDADLKLLGSFPNLYVFAPTFDELFHGQESDFKVEVGEVATLLEGAWRPGHFDGVVQVVHALFRLVEPNAAFFGEKDYQQLAIIKIMVRKLGLPIEIMACPTQRSPEGLAMSSRNMLLNTEEKRQALIIWETLNYIKNNQAKCAPKQLQELGKIFFNSGHLRLEYLEIVCADTLESVSNWETKNICCIAAYCGNTRLIDNLVLN
jgi:pantoate--beta-alanine ligase